MVGWASYNRVGSVWNVGSSVATSVLDSMLPPNRYKRPSFRMKYQSP